MRAEKIYLIGFMAAGKSSLARALAERLKWHVEDIDDRIEVREHKTISELFSQRGGIILSHGRTCHTHRNASAQSHCHCDRRWHLR